MFNHILLEVYCLRDENEKIPLFCESDCMNPGYYCLCNHCVHMAYTSHENALCYVNEKSVAEEIIALGGDMMPESLKECDCAEKWKEIAIGKVNEAYEEYMKRLKINSAEKSE